MQFLQNNIIKDMGHRQFSVCIIHKNSEDCFENVLQENTNKNWDNGTHFLLKQKLYDFIIHDMDRNINKTNTHYFLHFDKTLTHALHSFPRVAHFIKD